jgi:hypothetical protein
MNEPVPGASGSGSVVLDLGSGVGALVLHATQELDGREIEISPAGSAPGHRTHSRVRPRALPGGTKYAAVYPQLPAGDYTIWLDVATPGPVITISESTVTTAWWPT